MSDGTSAGGPALRVAGVSFAYGRRTVLRDVSLEVARGAMVALAGPNGSGKSTLLALLAGTRRAQHGTVEIHERPIAAYERRALARLIAVVPQDTTITFPYTVAEMVLMGRAPHRPRLGLEGAHDVAVAERVMGETGILALADRRITELSGGERQRVIVARALAQEPAVLLLDEPTTHLDLRHAADILDLVAAVNRARGVTVVAVLHDLGSAALYFDRIAFLREGSVVADGSPNATITAETIKAVFDAEVRIDVDADGIPAVLTAPPAPERMMKRAWLAGTLALVVTGVPVGAAVADADPSADKRRYSLFNPTPREQMRELETDRPDKTESAYTVDAGHVQLECDLATYARDRYTLDGTRVDRFTIAPLNLKLGLTNRVDLQLLIETYQEVRSEDRATDVVTHQRGFGDLTLRLKVNAWGNDGGRTALALMPYLKIPTNQDDLGNDAVEGGVIFPLAVALPAEFGMGLMTEVDVNQDASGSGYHPELVDTITFSHALVGDLSGYVEFFSLVSTENAADWEGTVDLGLTYAVTENVQLDGGVNVGVTRAAEDVEPFLGLSIRR